MTFANDHAVASQAREDAQSGCTLPEIMARALDLLDEHAPRPLWAEFRSIDFADDVRQAEAAVERVVAEQPPPSALSAVMFLLYELRDDEFTVASTSSVIELSGATTYPEDEWAYGMRNVMWFPDDAYLPTPGLQGLAGAALRDDEVHGGDDGYGLATYDLAFAHALGLAADVVRGPAGRTLLGGRERLGVAAGFHDGDLLLLGELTSTGLDLSSFGWC